MIVKLQKSWFDEFPRNTLSNRLNKQIDNRLSAFIPIVSPDDRDDDFIYSAAVTTSELNVLYTVRYLTVDCSGRKPWLVRKAIKTLFTYDEMKTFKFETLDRMMNMVAFNTFSAMVQHQTNLKLFNTMELN